MTSPLFATASFEADDSDGGIVVARNQNPEHAEDEEREGDNAVVINTSQQTDSSVLGEISIMKDFFVSAFSDGYYNGAGCCGVGDYIVSSTNCAPNGCYTSAKLPTAPLMDGTPQTVIRGSQIGRTTSSLSQNSNTVQSNSSLDGRRSKQRRKRPLAVAVGFKYAEDMHGRPVVITPGRIPRRLAVRQPRTEATSSSQQSSPASQPRTYAKPATDITILTQQLMLPLESDASCTATSPPAYQPKDTDETRGP